MTDKPWSIRSCPHVVYFLHRVRSAEQRWQVVAFGSVWIMHNATANMAHGVSMGSEAVGPQR